MKTERSLRRLEAWTRTWAVRYLAISWTASGWLNVKLARAAVDNKSVSSVSVWMLNSVKSYRFFKINHCVCVDMAYFLKNCFKNRAELPRYSLDGVNVFIYRSRLRRMKRCTASSAVSATSHWRRHCCFAEDYPLRTLQLADPPWEGRAMAKWFERVIRPLPISLPNRLGSVDCTRRQRLPSNRRTKLKKKSSIIILRNVRYTLFIV